MSIFPTASNRKLLSFEGILLNSAGEGEKACPEVFPFPKDRSLQILFVIFLDPRFYWH